MFVTFMLSAIRDALQEIQNTHVGENVGDNVGEDLAYSEARCLEAIQKKPGFSAKKLADQLHLTSRQVERLLASLKAKKKIERVGPDRGGSWKVL